MKKPYLRSAFTLLSILASTAAFSQEVIFSEEFGVVSEDGASIEVRLEIDAAPTLDASVDVTLTGLSFATAQEGTDFSFAGGTYTFPAFSGADMVINIPILDNGMANNDKLFVIELSNAVNCLIGDDNTFVTYILDDESSAPVGSEELEFELINSYLVDADGSAEIVAFNKPLKRLYVMNSTRAIVEILDFSDPRNIEVYDSIDLSSFGADATSVTCNNAIVAAAVANGADAPGVIVFMNKNGVILSTVEVGYLPDMVVFTPDNNYLLVANEGEPMPDYSFDPEGSISVIDLSNGANNLTQDDVITLDFHGFDADIDALRASGVRIFGLGSSVSQDLEPEYITVAEDSETAWVSLQENNAIATIDLVNMEITEILPLGVKDHRLESNSLDISDRNDSIFFATWNVRGMYLPDAIGSYTVDGVTYIVTANEGDQREYDGVNEDSDLGDIDLDPTAYPEAELLDLNHLLGRVAVTPYNGDTDGDGDIDEIHIFGGRSFSIFNSETGELVYDSGDDFERITAADPVFGSLFNASNSNNSFKNRSDNKGPEPEGVAIAEIDDQFYAMITLERTGGFMCYNITDPMNPVFVDYQNSRDLGEDEGGDLGPEGIIYIDPKESPSDTAMVVIANEISATISIYNINNVVKGPKGPKNKSLELNAGMYNDLIVYPNPTSGDRVFFNEPISFQIYSMQGQLVAEGMNKALADISRLDAGVYLLRSLDGRTERIVIQ